MFAFSHCLLHTETMVLVSILFAELVFLYLCSRATTNTLYLVLHRLTRSRVISIALLAFVYFPGTIAHELAHLFTAEILGVRTGKLTLVPENLHDNTVNTGSVTIAQTDPFRRTFIALAPIFLGMILLSLLAYFFRGSLDSVIRMLQSSSQMDIQTYGIFFLLVYLMYAVSNSMFSSPTDMKGVWPVLILLGLVPIALFIAGVQISFPESATTILTQAAEGLASSLGIVLSINSVMLLIGKGILKLLS